MALCEAVTPFGIAKIQHVQDKLGLPPDAMFVGAPDATVTRNKQRWRQGFGYGGAFSWTGELAVLDIKSNACGMLVGALPELPEAEVVRERAKKFERDGLELDGVPIDYDLQESNHFVNVLEATSGSPPGGARHFFIMHSSGHEHRGASQRGIGLYYDESQELARAARKHETPWGTLSTLEGDDAQAWFQFYKRVQDFNHRRRNVIARSLFGDYTEVCNETHQGLVRGLNRANVGCYVYDSPEDKLFPLTLSAELPAYLVRGRRNFDESALESLGWGERAERHGVLARLGETNILPHGGGYTFPTIRGVERVLANGPDERRYELLRTSEDVPSSIEDPRSLPYLYRGMEVKQRMDELRLGDAVVELSPLYVV